MSQRHLSIRAAAILAAGASALAPVTDLIANRRRQRRDNDEDDDDDKLGKRRRRDNDDDEDNDGRAGIRSNRRSRQDADDEATDGDSGRKTSGAKRDPDSTGNDGADDDTGAGAGAGRDSMVSGRQSIAGDLDIQGIIQDRLDEAFAGRGDGGGNDEPNIIVSEEGDTLVALTNDIDFAGDSTGFEVDTGGISYSSDSFSGDAGGDIDREFTS